MLEQKIKTAFPVAFKDSGLTHDECVYLRPRLISLTKEYFDEVFAQVLLDLVETHTGDPGSPEYVESVVQFLDIDGDGHLFDFNFNNEQAETIVEWLKTAKEWPDLKFDIDEVESALSYWTKRALCNR